MSLPICPTRSVYAPLSRSDQSLEIDTFPHDTITILHWDIKLTGKYKHGGGKLSKGDQRVLSRDVRVKWVLPEHHANEVQPKRKKSQKTAASNKKSKT